MATDRDSLNDYLADLLEIDAFKDYCPNGLQVTGKTKIERVVSGVTACQALIEKAISLKADAILVHHGYFWKGENPVIDQMKQRRLKSLLTHDINLFGYHLPLDYHKQLGNNAELARVMDWSVDGDLIDNSKPHIGLIGKIGSSHSPQELARSLEEKLGHTPLLIEGGTHDIKTLAWVTGGAQDWIDYAIKAGVDAFVSGEISERTTHIARECGIHYFAAGHHATERYGVQALGEHLANEFGVDHKFVDIDNPV